MPEGQSAALIVWTLVMGLLLAAVFRRRRGRTIRPGAAAVGSIYDMLNEDRRRAIELIVEKRAEARDPETADDVPNDGVDNDRERGAATSAEGGGRLAWRNQVRRRDLI